MDPDTKTRPKTATVPETSELLGISRSAGYRLVASGVIPTVRLGRRLLVPRSWIDDFLAASVDQWEAS